MPLSSGWILPNNGIYWCLSYSETVNKAGPVQTAISVGAHSQAISKRMFSCTGIHKLSQSHTVKPLSLQDGKMTSLHMNNQCDRSNNIIDRLKQTPPTSFNTWLVIMNKEAPSIQLSGSLDHCPLSLLPLPSPLYVDITGWLTGGYDDWLWVCSQGGLVCHVSAGDSRCYRFNLWGAQDPPLICPACGRLQRTRREHQTSPHRPPCFYPSQALGLGQGCHPPQSLQRQGQGLRAGPLNELIGWSFTHFHQYECLPQ